MERFLATMFVILCVFAAIQILWRPMKNGAMRAHYQRVHHNHIELRFETGDQINNELHANWNGKEMFFEKTPFLTDENIKVCQAGSYHSGETYIKFDLINKISAESVQKLATKQVGLYLNGELISVFKFTTKIVRTSHSDSEIVSEGADSPNDNEKDKITQACKEDGIESHFYYE